MHKFTGENGAAARSMQPVCRTRCLAMALALVTGISALPGCSVWQQARRTIWYEPIAYPWKSDRQRSLKAYRSWAEQAWQNESGACPGGPPSKHYELGFKDGFVDFVYAGGDGQPPPVPPRKYWNLTWRSPQGHSAADEWFAGYLHGAKAARAGGYRNLGVVYSSLRSTGRPAMQEPLLLGAPQVVSEDLGPPSEVLPLPALVTPDESANAAAKDVRAQKANPSPDAPAADAMEQVAPVLGPPAVEPGAEAELSAEAPVDAGGAPPDVPLPPTPPASDVGAPPDDAAPAAKPQGAAMMFRRAISAATSNLQTDAHLSSGPRFEPPTGDAGARTAQVPPVISDAGPPQWPTAAVDVGDEVLPEIVPVSAIEHAIEGPLAPRPNILRRPKN